MRITIFDYGAGNLHSLAKAISTVGVEPAVETDPTRAIDTDLLVLPGVGAFPPAAERLAPGLDAMRRALVAGLPCLGICLGMQLLFESSDEGPGPGLGLIPGRVTRLEATRIPEIGWSPVSSDDPAFERAGLEWGYYANSYVCRPGADSVVVAWSEYERDRFPAAVRSGATLGLQFHPEKSSGPGVALIRAFLEESAS